MKLLNSQTLINLFRKYYAEHGYVPTLTLFCQYAGINYGVFYRRFKNYKSLIEQTGLETSFNYYSISDQELFDELNRLCRILYYQPRSSDWIRLAKYSRQTISYRFKTWENFLKAAKFDPTGIPVASHGLLVSDGEIIQSIRDIAKILKRTPKYYEYLGYIKEGKAYSPETIRRAFGSWENLVKASKLPYTAWKVSEPMVKQDVIRVKELINKYPILSDYKKYGKYPRNTVVNFFGKSWKDVLKKIFYLTNDEILKLYKRKYKTNDELLDEVKALAKKLGYTPNTTLAQKKGINLKRLIKAFGTWKQVLKEVKLSNPRHKTKNPFTYTDEQLYEELKRVCELLGRVPSHTEFHLYSKIAVQTIAKRLGEGSYPQAVKQLRISFQKSNKTITTSKNKNRNQKTQLDKKINDAYTALQIILNSNNLTIKSTKLIISKKFLIELHSKRRYKVQKIAKILGIPIFFIEQLLNDYQIPIGVYVSIAPPPKAINKKLLYEKLILEGLSNVETAEVFRVPRLTIKKLSIDFGIVKDNEFTNLNKPIFSIIRQTRLKLKNISFIPLSLPEIFRAVYDLARKHLMQEKDISLSEILYAGNLNDEIGIKLLTLKIKKAPVTKFDYSQTKIRVSRIRHIILKLIWKDVASENLRNNLLHLLNQSKSIETVEQFSVFLKEFYNLKEPPGIFASKELFFLIKEEQIYFYQNKPVTKIEEIIQKYKKENLEIKQIADLYGVTYGNIQSRLIRAGVTLRSREKKQIISSDILVQLYVKERLSVVEIAERLNFSWKKISHDLKYHGIGKPRKYPEFDTLALNEKVVVQYTNAKNIHHNLNFHAKAIGIKISIKILDKNMVQITRIG